jgi:sigma54-dependent transcription regulator
MSQTATTKRSIANPGRVTVDYGEDLVEMLTQARQRESRDTLANLLRTVAREYLASKYPDLAAELERRQAAP